MIMAWLLDTCPELIIINESPFVEIVELGAGCGLAGLTAARLLDHHGLKPARILLTDLPEVISTTLTTNVTQIRTQLANPEMIDIRAEPLRWGTSVTLPASTSVSGTNFFILANDVLYNPENQSVFLQSMLQLFELHLRLGHVVEALIGYRPRTDGDVHFFRKAEQAGLTVKRIARLGTILIFRLSPSTPDTILPEEFRTRR